MSFYPSCCLNKLLLKILKFLSPAWTSRNSGLGYPVVHSTSPSRWLSISQLTCLKQLLISPSRPVHPVTEVTLTLLFLSYHIANRIVKHTALSSRYVQIPNATHHPLLYQSGSGPSTSGLLYQFLAHVNLCSTQHIK